MCNFTKGPWDWEHNNSTSSIIQVFSKSIEAEGSPGICRLQHEPDAHLIASAPEMYEMLEELKEVFFKNDSSDCTWNDIEKLLAKARGEHV